MAGARIARIIKSEFRTFLGQRFLRLKFYTFQCGVS
jgi:hypothetical protein